MLTENIPNLQELNNKETDVLKSDAKIEAKSTDKQNANVENPEVMKVSEPKLEQIEIKVETFKKVEGNSKITPGNVKKSTSGINFPSKIKKLSTIPKTNVNATKSIKNEEVDIEAIKKEENEIREDEKQKKKGNLDTLVVQQKLEEVQKQLDEIKSRHESQKQAENEIHKKVNEEKLKAVKAIENIAKKAIESLTNNDEKVPTVIAPVKPINDPNASAALNKSLLLLPEKSNKTKSLDSIKNADNSSNKHPNDKNLPEVAKNIPNQEKNKTENKPTKVDGIANAAPLSYQLGLNIPPANQKEINEFKLKRFIPLPLAEKYALHNITNTTLNSEDEKSPNRNENHANNITKEPVEEKITENKDSVHVNENKNKQVDDIQAIRRDILSDKTNQREKRDVEAISDENEACEKRSSNN